MGPAPKTKELPGAGGLPDLRSVAANLNQVLSEYAIDPSAARRVQKLAGDFPDLFFRAAAAYLETNPETRITRYLATLLIRQEWFFERLTDPGRSSLASAVATFRCLLKFDPSLEFRLAFLLPRRNNLIPRKVLTRTNAERAIDILERTSEGQRLFSVLGHLTNDGDPGISAKAALFVGRRTENPDWTAKQLLSDNERLRANALEAFWGSSTPESLRILNECVRDQNNRVAGNALVGLHQGGHPGVEDEALAMSQAEDPERRVTAVWAMGRIGMASFTGRLTELLKDEDPHVRSMAIRSLATIRQQEKQRIGATPVSPAESAPAAAVPPTRVPAPVNETQPAPDPEKRGDDSILKLKS
jgi:hypothetical protein